MRKVLLSLLTVGAVALVVVAATGAFFSDVETSTGNTFTAGELDLMVDSTCHYWTDADADDTYTNVGCGVHGTWTMGDLTSEKFFYFTDVKPGDYGENTISLHVYENDAWGRLVIDNLANDDNGLTEPENDVDTTGGVGDGELRQNLRFWVWLDQGSTAGFQGKDPIDLGEGDNIFDPAHELMLINPGDIDAGGETWYLAPGLVTAYSYYTCVSAPPSVCQGLTSDGHMVGSVTYYFGIRWDLPSDVGNIVQSDSFSGDMTIEVEQYRNNPTPFPTP